MNFWRIPDLSENFVIFNDDYFVLNPIEERYFFENDFTCDEAVESPIMPVDVGSISGYACWTKANNIILLNKHFNKRIVQEKNRDKWFNPCYGELLERNERLSYWNNFCGFHDPHLPNSLRKSTMKSIWEEEPAALDIASRNVFRAENDISWFLVRYWQLCTGEFVPRKALGKTVVVTSDNFDDVAEFIVNRELPFICICRSL